MYDEERAELECAIAHRFRQPRWLERALTHSSCRQQTLGGQSAEDNERLEFLGDAVLGLVVSQYLLETFPDWTEGRLSKSKAGLVSARSLHAAARRLKLGRYLQLGRSEERTGGREKRALLVDAYEALIGAVYLDAGLDAAAQFVRRSFLEEAISVQAQVLGEPDYKSALQEWLQGKGQPPPEYRVIAEKGPEHCKTFGVEVRIEGRTVATSEGTTKKEAEQEAARLAFEHLRESADQGRGA